MKKYLNIVVGLCVVIIAFWALNALGDWVEADAETHFKNVGHEG